MYECGEHMSDVSAVAQTCLAYDGRHDEALLVYSFKDDNDAHDDALQERLWTEFRQTWLTATAELEKKFGPAVIAEKMEETRWVPLCGVGGVSSWKTDCGLLWIAYAHEDRECPFLLLVGKLP